MKIDSGGLGDPNSIANIFTHNGAPRGRWLAAAMKINSGGLGDPNSIANIFTHNGAPRGRWLAAIHALQIVPPRSIWRT